MIHHTDILGNAKKVGCESGLFYLQTNPRTSQTPENQNVFIFGPSS